MDYGIEHCAWALCDVSFGDDGLGEGGGITWAVVGSGDGGQTTLCRPFWKIARILFCKASSSIMPDFKGLG